MDGRNLESLMKASPSWVWQKSKQEEIEKEENFNNVDKS